MAETISGLQETPAGLFVSDTLPEFDIQQSWQRTAYWSLDYFGELGNRNSLLRVDNQWGDRLNLLYSDVVLGMRGRDTVRYKMNSEKIEVLRNAFEKDGEAITALEGLQKKIDSQEATRVQARNKKIGEIVVTNRGSLHVLTQYRGPAASGKIKGYFGKLWGITITQDKYRPVVVGKDGNPAVTSPESLWLYSGSVD